MGSTGRRSTTTAGEAEPMWERLLMLYYAVAVTAVVSSLMLVSARSILRRRRSDAGREPAGDVGNEPRSGKAQTVPRLPVGLTAYFSSLSGPASRLAALGALTIPRTDGGNDPGAVRRTDYAELGRVG